MIKKLNIKNVELIFGDCLSDLKEYEKFDGILSAAITGGTPSYTYTWSNAQTSSSATSLCSGNHVPRF